MSNRGLWSGIAGAANAIGGILVSREADERKSKLYQQEQDILAKRQEALAYVRGDITDKNAGNRSDRAMDREAFKKGLDSGDITGQFKDDETGNMYGRRKDGSVVPLNITSDDYQSTLSKTATGKADAAALGAPLRQAQIDHTVASTANVQSTMEKRDSAPTPDKMGPEIRKSFQANFAKAHDDWAKDAAAARKAGTAEPEFDTAAAMQTAQASLYPVYGADAVNASVGGGANAPTQAAPAAPGPSSAPPDGTRVKGPDGKLYVVKNAHPVPI